MTAAYLMALTGLGLMVLLSGCGSAIGTVIGGSATLGMLKKRPEMFGNGLVLSALPATQGLYGFVAFFLYSTVVKTDISLFNGMVVWGAGLMVGVVCLVSGIYQGKVCASGIEAIGGGNDVFGNTMILAAFPEFYAILSLVAAILLKGVIA